MDMSSSKTTSSSGRPWTVAHLRIWIASAAVTTTVTESGIAPSNEAASFWHVAHTGEITSTR